MAFVEGPLPNQEQNTQAPSGQTTPNPLGMLPPQTTSTGGSAGQGGGSSGTNPPGVGTSTQFGTNASKLSDYLSANAGQVQQMGQNIAGNLTNQYNQVNADIGNAVSGFGQQVAGGYTPQDKSVVDQAAANPTQFASTPGNASAFQSQLNDQYTGPTSFESTTPYANIQGEVNQAVQGAGLLNNPAGISSYLNSNVEQNATPGQNTLDSILLQTEPQSIKAVQDAAAPYAGLTNYLAGQTQQANTAVPLAQQSAQQAAQYAQGQINPVVSNWQTGLNKTIASNEAQRAAYNSAQSNLLAAVQGGGEQLSPAQLSQLGNPSYPAINEFNNLSAIDTQQYGGTNNVNLANYLQGNISPFNTVANAANSASPTDYATADAFAQLEGQGFSNPLPAQASTPWALPQSTAYLNANQALIDQGAALKSSDQNFLASVGNPTLVQDPLAPGSPSLAGYSSNGGSNPAQSMENAIAALQRLSNPTAYSGVDQTVTPPTTGTGVNLGTAPVTSGGGKAAR